MTKGGARADCAERILFVCTANICRSPMAEAMFNALAEDKGLACRAESAGVAALIDEDMVLNARAALEEIGIYAQTHRARQVGEAMLEEVDLVLAMSPWHAAELRRRFWSLSDKVHTLQEYATSATGEDGIPDPHGHAMPAYRASVRQLFECIDRLVERLEREEVFR